MLTTKEIMQQGAERQLLALRLRIKAEVKKRSTDPQAANLKPHTLRGIDRRVRDAQGAGRDTRDGRNGPYSPCPNRIVRWGS